MAGRGQAAPCDGPTWSQRSQHVPASSTCSARSLRVLSALTARAQRAHSACSARSQRVLSAPRMQAQRAPLAELAARHHRLERVAPIGRRLQHRCGSVGWGGVGKGCGVGRARERGRTAGVVAAAKLQTAGRRRQRADGQGSSNSALQPLSHGSSTRHGASRSGPAAEPAAARTLAQRERVCERDSVCHARHQHQRPNVAQARRLLGGQADQVVLSGVGGGRRQPGWTPWMCGPGEVCRLPRRA